MPQVDLVIRGQRVVLPDGPIAPASIHITHGIIASVSDYEDVAIDAELIEVKHESIVMPGLVDTHVHVNEPGRTAWEGFATATKAAAAGGVTTLVDMPLNSIPPTTSRANLNIKKAAAADQCFVDVGFWGGVIPGNTTELAGLIGGGVVGFKCFLIHSGVDEFPNVTEADLRVAMPELSRLNALLIVHAELPGPIEEAAHSPTGASGAAAEYQTFLNSRPRAAEDQAVALMIKLAREFGTAVHIVHHSSADALPMLRRAKAEGVKLTVETCPHYLYFAAEEIPAGATEFKCCPPIRERENREQLWNALADGTIDFIVSDHSPCTADLKLRDSGDFLDAWGGISSLQFRLPIVWTAAGKRGFSIGDVVKWLCSGPAAQVGLGSSKGAIAAGYDADLVIWNPDQFFQLESAMIQHRNKLTPYRGEQLRGVVQKTFLRGRKIYDDGEFFRPPLGKFVGRHAGNC